MSKIAEALRRDVTNILHAVQCRLDGRSFADLVDHPVVRVERGEIVLGGRGHDGCNYELALKSDVMSRRVGSETITDAGRLELAERERDAALAEVERLRDALADAVEGMTLMRRYVPDTFAEDVEHGAYLTRGREAFLND